MRGMFVRNGVEVKRQVTGHPAKCVAKDKKLGCSSLAKSMSVSNFTQTCFLVDARPRNPDVNTIIRRNTFAFPTFFLFSMLIAALHCEGSDRTESAATEKKASEIIFPAIDARDATIQELVEFMQQKSKALDDAKKGVPIVLTIADAVPNKDKYSQTRLTLSLTYIPLLEALKYVAFLGDYKFRIHKDTIIMVPTSDTWTFPKLYDSFDWQRKAVARYPDLGTSGSTLHTAFMQEYRLKKAEDNALLSKPDWPMVLAARVAFKIPNLRPPIAEAADPFEYIPPNPDADPKLTIPAAGGSAAQVAKRSFPSVAMLIMADNSNQPISQGSGFVIAKNIVVTNHHVVQGAQAGFVKFVGDNNRYKITRILRVDEAADLALVEVAAPHVAPLPLSGDATPDPGEEIYAIGAPKGLDGTFSKGNISSVRVIDKSQLLQITAPISAGSSGGPILNTKGEVVGVAVATYKEGQNLNFAVPVRYVRQLFNSR